MTSDEIDDLRKFLTCLRNDPNKNYTSEEISNETDIPLENTKAIMENALLNQWVSAITYGDDRTPVVKINHDGNKKLNQLTGKSEPFPSSDDSRHITITGRNVNIGTGNTIASDSVNSLTSSSNWVKWGTIFGGISVLVMIVFFVVTLPQTSVDNPTKIENSLSNSQLDLKLTFLSGNNLTQALIVLSNPADVSASNVRITINPTQKIHNFTTFYYVDDITLNQNGERSLIGKMQRISSCSTIIFSVFTDGKFEDNDYAIHVTSDNAKTLDYLTKIDGKSLMKKTETIKQNPC